MQLYQVIWWRGDTGHSIEAIDFASFKTGFDEMYGNKVSRNRPLRSRKKSADISCSGLPRDCGDS
jgi:hypothetical protein